MSKYAESGVDIDAGARAVELMKAAVQATHGPEVLAGVGAFGGLFDAMRLKGMAQPVLVASTDGVGTKTKIAAALGDYRTIGHDIVNHCVNDILVQGAEPLFFLDYVAASRLDPERIATIVRGAAEACGAAGCALLGGETAEMPGVYEAGEFDLVGTIVGVVDRTSVIDGSAIEPGDVVLGLASSGLHTNGYSLARRIVEDFDLHAERAELGGRSLGAALLAPHRSYLPAVRALRAAGVTPKGLVHVTGGGLVDNPPRILPAACAVRIRRGNWPTPPLFALLQREGAVHDDEMVRVFNCGLGMLVVVGADDGPRAVALAEAAGERAWRVGEIVPRGDGPAVIFGD